MPCQPTQLAPQASPFFRIPDLTIPVRPHTSPSRPMAKPDSVISVGISPRLNRLTPPPTADGETVLTRSHSVPKFSDSWLTPEPTAPTQPQPRRSGGARLTRSHITTTSKLQPEADTITSCQQNHHAKTWPQPTTLSSRYVSGIEFPATRTSGRLTCGPDFTQRTALGSRCQIPRCREK